MADAADASGARKKKKKKSPSKEADIFFRHEKHVFFGWIEATVAGFTDKFDGN